jgi:hypothetical protein
MAARSNIAYLCCSRGFTTDTILDEVRGRPRACANSKHSVQRSLSKRAKADSAMIAGVRISSGHEAASDPKAQRQGALFSLLFPSISLRLGQPHLRYISAYFLVPFVSRLASN